MTRFDSPGQVVLLFTGAAFVSIVLIALLNVEARNRKIKEPEITNENLFEFLGKQIQSWTTWWRHRNSSVSESGFRVNMVKRSLKSIRHDGDNKLDHPVRHHGKHRHKEEPLVDASTTPVVPPEEWNHTSPHSRRMYGHDMCYSTNQVLMVIAITCGVNFAFIFVVMTLVNLCNRSGDKLSRLNSVVIAENGDYDIPDQKLTSDCHSLRRETSSYDSVQQYVNSLPNSFNKTASMLSLHSLHVTRNLSQENLLKKSNSLHTSFSMEDLLFVG